MRVYDKPWRRALISTPTTPLRFLASLRRTFNTISARQQRCLHTEQTMVALRELWQSTADSLSINPKLCSVGGLLRIRELRNGTVELKLSLQLLERFGTSFDSVGVTSIALRLFYLKPSPGSPNLLSLSLSTRGGNGWPRQYQNARSFSKFMILSLDNSPRTWPDL